MNIQPFALLLGLSASLGLAWVAWRTPQIARGKWVTAGLWALLGALIGARAGFALANPAYFAPRPTEVFQVWLGGLNWAGAVIGALLALLAVALKRRIHPGLLADGLLPLALTLSVGGWLGCWLAGCAYGTLAAPPWPAVPAADESGVILLRFPLQLVAAALLTLCFALLERLRADFPHPGQFASLGMVLLCGLQFAVSFLRADASPLWQGWRWDAWAALGCTMIATLCYLLASLQPKWKQYLARRRAAAKQ